MYQDMKPLIVYKKFIITRIDEDDRRIFFNCLSSYNGNRPAYVTHTVCHLDGRYTIYVTQDFENHEFTRFMEEFEKISEEEDQKRKTLAC